MTELLRRLSPGLFCAFALTVATLAPQLSAQTPEPRYAPLHIAGPRSFELAADPRFDAPDRGTLEFTIALAAEQPALPPSEDVDEASLCIAQHGSGSDTSWKLMVETREAGDVLRFGRPDGPQVTLQMALRGTGFRHVMFVTAGGRTQVVVDGQLMGEMSGDGVTPQPGVAFSPLPAVPQGRPLTLGCETGPTARAHVASFRLWDTVLLPEDAALLRDRPGPVADVPHLSDHLLAYAMFLDSSQTMRLTGERIFFTRFKGAQGGTPFFLKRPQGQELFGLDYRVDRARLSALTAVFDAPRREGVTLTTGPGWTDTSLPVTLPRATDTEAAERAAWIERRMRAAARFEDRPQEGSSAAEDFALFAGLLGTYRDAERVQSDRARRDGVWTRFAVPLARGERLRDAICTFAHDGILGCQWAGDSGARSPMMQTANARAGVFSLSVPDDARIEGIAGTRDAEGQVLSLALAFSRAPVGDAMEAQGRALAQGVWVARGAQIPVRDPGPADDTEQEKISGNYTTAPVFRFRSEAQGRKLILYVDAPHTDVTGEAEPPPEALAKVVAYVFEHQAGNWWVYQGGPLSTFNSMWIGRDSIRLGRFDDPADGGVMLERPADYPGGEGADKLSWGATFSLDHRPNGVEASFMGYHPARMRARDYQATTGADRPVLAMPDDASKDYTTNGSRVIVPHGLTFTLDSRGSERMDTQKIDTSMERQSSSTIGLGFSIGIPLIASFKADGSHQQSQETVNSSSFSMAVNRSVVTHYGLVLDRARARLDPAFRDAVIDLRNRQAARMAIDWDAFFDVFGTHYPHAVTYGGMAWSETTIRSDESSILQSTDDKLSVSGSGILDEVLEVGVSGNGEYSQGSKSTSGSLRDRTNFGTYGGSFSKGGGWSVPRGEELPTLLDLRPLPELLSPVFFDDPRIFVTLRATMASAFATHYADIAAAMKVQYPWATGIAQSERLSLPVTRCFDTTDALSVCIRADLDGVAIEVAEDFDGNQAEDTVNLVWPLPPSSLSACFAPTNKARICYTLTSATIDVTTELLVPPATGNSQRYEFDR